MGQTVWEREGTVPIVKVSKTLVEMVGKGWVDAWMRGWVDG
jgi:hypothetical protein